MSLISDLTTKLFTGLIRAFCGASVYCQSQLSDNNRRIYFANHTSNLDAVLIWATLPDKLRKYLRPVAARDYWETTALRRYVSCTLLNAVLLDRPSKTNRKGISTRQMVIEGLDVLVDTVNSGNSLIIFPEGTRSESGKLQGFKSGISYLARQCPDVEFVPVYIDNLNRIIPKGEILPVPMLSTIKFGEPFKLAAKETRKEFIDRAKQNLLKLKDNINE